MQNVKCCPIDGTNSGRSCKRQQEKQDRTGSETVQNDRRRKKLRSGADLQALASAAAASHLRQVFAALIFSFFRDKVYAHPCIYHRGNSRRAGGAARWKLNPMTWKLNELCEARSRLYRRQILQVNVRWKALDEIYKIYMFLHRSDLNISENFRQTFSHFSAKQKFVVFENSFLK